MSKVAVSQDLVRLRVRESIAVKEAMLGEALIGAVARLGEVVTDCIRNGGKVILFGNGGSAADATHVAAEFVGRFNFNRAPMPALSLSDNTSSITAIGNDYSYDITFARQIQAFGATGDVAIGLSTSGSSVNVVEGLKAAKAKGMFTAAFTGENGSVVAAIADICVMVPSEKTARIQEGYMLFAHVLCEYVEQQIFGSERLAA
jgi:D-sedoheptulose 7-phosphate isomerase